jgi:hypothetical protein
MSAPRELKQQWERRLPGLSGKWTHWKISGAGNLIAVVDGMDLIGALRIIEANYGRFISLKASRCTVDELGTIDEEDQGLFEISNLTNDQNLLRPVGHSSDSNRNGV